MAEANPVAAAVAVSNFLHRRKAEVSVSRGQLRTSKILRGSYASYENGRE